MVMDGLTTFMQYVSILLVRQVDMEVVVMDDSKAADGKCDMMVLPCDAGGWVMTPTCRK